LKRLETATNSKIRRIQTSIKQIIKSLDAYLKRFIRSSILYVKLVQLAMGDTCAMSRSQPNIRQPTSGAGIAWPFGECWNAARG
jgi:hypothetical protein